MCLGGEAIYPKKKFVHHFISQLVHVNLAVDKSGFGTNHISMVSGFAILHVASSTALGPE